MASASRWWWAAATVAAASALAWAVATAAGAAVAAASVARLSISGVTGACSGCFRSSRCIAPARAWTFCSRAASSFAAVAFFTAAIIAEYSPTRWKMCRVLRPRQFRWRRVAASRRRRSIR